MAARSSPVRAIDAAAPRSPSSIAARRTSASASPLALAIASVSTPALAPWRISPVRTRKRNRCSSAVASANRSCTRAPRWRCESTPCNAAMRVSAASTCAIVNVAAAAGGAFTFVSDDQPTPIRPCCGDPTRNPIVGSISTGSRSASTRARIATFCDRLVVAVTAAEALTNLSSCTTRWYSRSTATRT